MRIQFRFAPLFACAAVGLAAGATVAAAQVTVDARDTEDVLIQAGSGFVVSLKANNSYCCTVYPQNPNTRAGLSATIQARGNPGVTVAGTRRGAMEPAVTVTTEGSATDADQSDNRVCVTPAASGDYKFPISSAVSGEPIKVVCDNTTLNGGFNTNATPVNYLECTNLSDADVAARVFATDYAGQVLIAGQAVSLPAGLRRDFDVHSAVGPDRYGRLTVTHDGTRRAVRCVLSRYDRDLTLRSSLPLE